MKNGRIKADRVFKAIHKYSTVISQRSRVRLLSAERYKTIYRNPLNILTHPAPHI